jgi:hypothetical protein
MSSNSPRLHARSSSAGAARGEMKPDTRTPGSRTARVTTTAGGSRAFGAWRGPRGWRGRGSRPRSSRRGSWPRQAPAPRGPPRIACRSPRRGGGAPGRPRPRPPAPGPPGRGGVGGAPPPRAGAPPPPAPPAPPPPLGARPPPRPPPLGRLTELGGPGLRTAQQLLVEVHGRLRIGHDLIVVAWLAASSNVIHNFEDTASRWATSR